MLLPGEKSTLLAQVPGSVSVVEIKFELGTATLQTKDHARLDRMLQIPQHVAHLTITVDTLEEEDEVASNNASFLTLGTVKGTMVTNKTFYESALYPDGELFAKQYQTLSIEHVCPSGGWFPKLWGAGVRVTAVEVVVGVVGVAVVVDVF